MTGAEEAAKGAFKATIILKSRGGPWSLEGNVPDEIIQEQVILEANASTQMEYRSKSWMSE